MSNADRRADREAAALATLAEQRRPIDALRDQIAPDASDEELYYLAQVGQRLGLDPIKGEVILVSRWDSRLRRNVARPQVTADGRLVLAEGHDAYDGFDGPLWCGPRRFNADGEKLPLEWSDLWDDDEDPPYAARVLVWRKDRSHPANGTVKWAEFAQRTKDGALTQFWKTMPSHMLGKTALSLGLRRAFPGLIPADVDIADDLGDLEVPAPAPAGELAPRRPVTEDERPSDDDRAKLHYFVDDGQLPVPLRSRILDRARTDGLPNLDGPRFTVASRDRLAWRILEVMPVLDRPEGSATAWLSAAEWAVAAEEHLAEEEGDSIEAPPDDVDVETEHETRYDHRDAQPQRPMP